MSVTRFRVGAHEQKNEPAGGAGKYDRHDSFSFNSVALVSTGRVLIGSSHPLGDFEHEPAESGETDPPKKHHRDHRLPLLFTG